MTEKPKVYYLKKVSDTNVVRMYDIIGKELEGPIAVKIHSGEDGNINFMRPNFLKPIVDRVKGTICECNTAYEGARNYTDRHWKLMEKHDWTTVFPGKVCIMDEKPEDDVELKIDDGFKIKKNYVGKHMTEFKSMLVVAHFKAHGSGGYGGALKQLSIGCGSSAGKTYQQTAGFTTDQKLMPFHRAEQNDFLDSMADAATSVVRYFNGNMAFINVMTNISVSCDCSATAPPPCMQDMGILGSLDPVAIDQANIDMLLNSPDPGKVKILERINSLNGIRTIKRCEEHQIGRRDYELITIE